MNRLDAVLPLSARDLDRSEILRRSVRRYFSPLATCWVVVPDKDLELVSRAIKDPQYRVLPESALIPELKFHTSVRRVAKRASRLGWWVQQIIKFAIAEHVQTDFYLTLDADVICVRPVEFRDLVRDGRAKTKRWTMDDVHLRWYARSEQLLGLHGSGMRHAFTPSLFSRDVVIQLQKHLTDRACRGALSALRLLPGGTATRSLLGSWRAYLLRRLGWTEYALYLIFLEAHGLWDTYHYEEGRGITWNTLWHRRDLAEWDAARSFQNDEGFFFTVLQSNTGVGVLDVWEKVRPYLLDVQGERVLNAY